MKNRYLTILLIFFSFFSCTVQDQSVLKTNFSAASSFKKIGRGICKINNGKLTTKDTYANFGDESWTNYEITFDARTPKSEEQVQIWSGFRTNNYFDRYVVGLRGGIQDDIYLARMGYMGTDEFLAYRKLDFHPKTGKWYQLKIQVCESRIRIFINDETIPRIDVIDTNSSLIPSGKVSLGGSWIKTEFDNLKVTFVTADALKNIKKVEFNNDKTTDQKETKRIEERAVYRAVKVESLTQPRTQISLDGQWLFMPEYELANEKVATSPNVEDQNWHSINVPNFWNPSRIWLHGETFGPHAKGASDIYFNNETQRCKDYTFNYKKTGVAWYRQWVDLPENAANKHIELIFDAISKVSEVWINGTFAGEHLGMFGEFNIDGSKLFKPGKNLITVKVIRDFVKDIDDADKIVDVAVSVEVTNKMLKDMAHGFFRDDPAGIWQPVNLIITNTIEIDEVFIKPNLKGSELDITIANHGNTPKQLTLSTLISDEQTKLYNGEEKQPFSIAAGEVKTITYNIENLSPKLWTPGEPNLYDFKFSLNEESEIIDEKNIVSGFRTFESKNGFLYLNGERYWLRGGNQTPFALAPNNKELADTFYQLMKAGNMEVTRTHTTPYNKLWMDAADQNGIGISFEGTWPWLMIHSSMPEKYLIDLWEAEFYEVIKKYRNHPSLLFWTVNNEMKFYDNEPDFEVKKQKMKIISDVVKKMRKIDPTRPICFDSNYHRNEKKLGKEFYKGIDDGDIDDVHAYTNWYNHTVFREFNGQFQRSFRNEGRPLIGQETSTGYPNSETGHATRFYTFMHQNPQSLVGNRAYEFSDPAYFLKQHAFITGELAEALRRTNDKASGILHFALLTWFRNVYNAEKIEPYPTYYAIQRALQPVLVSAEIWGRHFYAGEKIPTRVCIVNDQQSRVQIEGLTLNWQLVDENETVFSEGYSAAPDVDYYQRKWFSPEIQIPASLSNSRVNGKLKLQLKNQQNEVISKNEYELVFAQKKWSTASIKTKKKVLLLDFNNTSKVLQFLKIDHQLAESVNEASITEADLYVFAGLDSTNITSDELNKIQQLFTDGKKVLVLNSETVAHKLYPDFVKGYFRPTEGDIANLEVPEHSAFNSIEPLDLRYFNNNKSEYPTVCNASYQIVRSEKLTPLAVQMNIHGYIEGTMEQRSKYVESIRGFPIVQISDNVTVILSSMLHQKALTDPVAGKLVSNLFESLLNENNND